MHVGWCATWAELGQLKKRRGTLAGLSQLRCRIQNRILNSRFVWVCKRLPLFKAILEAQREYSTRSGRLPACYCRIIFGGELTRARWRQGEMTELAGTTASKFNRSSSGFVGKHRPSILVAALRH